MKRRAKLLIQRLLSTLSMKYERVGIVATRVPAEVCYSCSMELGTPASAAWLCDIYSCNATENEKAKGHTTATAITLYFHTCENEGRIAGTLGLSCRHLPTRTPNAGND